MSMEMDEIIKKLEENPQNIMFLYRWLGIRKYKWKERERLCNSLLKSIDKLKDVIPTVAYAKEASNERGWDYVDYRRNDRNGYPKEARDVGRNEEPLQGEDYLAMDIFLISRIQGGNLPERVKGLGYILDYQMPIGGTPTL